MDTSVRTLSLICLLIVYTIHQGSCSTPMTGVVVCTPEGFSPTFTYDVSSTDMTLQVDVTIGSDGSVADCTATESVTTGNAELVRGDFSAGYTNFIPYMQDDGSGGTETRCGGSFVHWNEDGDGSNGDEKIKYEVSAVAIVTRTFRSNVIRKTRYPFTIRCSLTRSLPVISSNTRFTIDSAMVDAAGSQDVTQTIPFTGTLAFYESDYSTAKADNQVLSPKNSGTASGDDSKLYMAVTQPAAQQGLFKFVVEQCYATATQTETTANKKDIFFDNQCHADSTVTFVHTGTQFNLEIVSFAFTAETAAEIWFHCKALICLASTNEAECTQKTQAACTASNPNTGANFDRKRRSPEEVLGYKTITSKQSVLLERSQVFAPSCGEGFIYDRVLGACSNNRLVEIKGIHLGAETWKPAYGNTSSEEFKIMAAEKEYQLFVLMKVTGKDDTIHGVKVMSAKKGSVILDVVVKYSTSSSPEQAFEEFVSALHTKPSVSRVIKLLKVRHDNTIQYAPIVVGEEKPDDEKIVLIIIVAVLLAVVLIAAGALCNVRCRSRRDAAEASAAQGMENKGVEA